MFRYRPLTLALLAALAHGGAQAEGSDAQRLLIEQGHFWQAQDKPKRAGEVWQKLLLIDAAQPDALYGLGFIAVITGGLHGGHGHGHEHGGDAAHESAPQANAPASAPAHDH